MYNKLLKVFYTQNFKLFNRNIILLNMANSRYEYVKEYELDDRLLPNTWIVIRLDGKGFHKFSKYHNFERPNDLRALNLMNYAAVKVMEEFRDIILAYGQSDEYSFIFRKDTNIYNRRSSKLLTYVTSLFTSSYIYNWNKWFINEKLKYPPSFDGRIVLYPTDQNLKDYLSWRQADVHINNLYNTTFWNLVLNDGLTNAKAEEYLRGTLSSDKNEILFQKFNINYNTVPAIYRKGTILLRKYIKLPNTIDKKQLIIPIHDDMIKEKFWNKHYELLGKYVPQEYYFKNCNNIDNDDNNDTSNNEVIKNDEILNDNSNNVNNLPELIVIQYESILNK